MFDDHYISWQQSRLSGIIKYLGYEFFENKTLHEIGCGYAFFGNHFSKYCNNVIVSDGRKEHIDKVHELYPNLKAIVLNVNDKFEIDPADILIHFGTLYHITDIENHMNSLKNKFNYIILESEVCDSDEIKSIVTSEVGYDQSINEHGIRPSQKLIEQLLSNIGFNFLLIKDNILNSSFHTYDWEILNTNTWVNGLRRFWICWKKELKSPIK